MSGTSNPLYVAPPDPLGALLKFAQGQQAQAGIGQTQAQAGLLGAQTGLTQQQTTGAELNNQQLQLMLGLRGALANSILPGSAPQGAGSGVLPPAATGGPAAGGGPPTNGQSAVAAADAQLPPAVTPFGATMSPFGVPLPRAQMIAAVMSGDPLKGVTDAYNMGRQRIVSLLTQAGNPQQVQDAAKQLYQEGWLDQRGYSNIYNHPESRQAFIDSMASPDAHMTQFTALTGQGLSKDENGNVQINPTAIGAKAAGAVASRTGETMDVTVPGPGGTKVTVKGTVMPDGSVVGLNGQPLRGAIPVAGGTGPGAAPPTSALIAPGATMSPEAWAAKNFKSEGGTAPDAGDGAAVGGFLPATFLETMKSSQPDLVAGKTDAQILAMRSDPNIVQQASIAYARANAPQLQAAGINPDASALRLAHWFGPTGAAAVLHAPQGTPLGQIISPTTLAANGLSPQMTSNQLLGRVVADYGTAAVPGITPGAVAPTAAAAPPAAAGIGTSAPQWTPQQQAAVDVDKGRLAEDQKLVAETQTGAMKAQASQPTILDLRQRAAADPAAFGAAGDLRTSIGNALATFGPEWTQNFTKWMTDNKIDPSTAGGRQAMGKEFFNMVTGAESQLPNTRIGAMLTQYFSKAMPNINMQGDAVKEMLNFALVGNQMARDYAQGASGHFNAANAAFPAQDPLTQRYAPLTQFDEKWTAPGAVSSPNVYEAASNILNGRTYGVWSKGLTRAQAADQQAEALKIALRSDPSFKIGPGQLPPRPASTAGP